MGGYGTELTRNGRKDIVGTQREKDEGMIDAGEEEGSCVESEGEVVWFVVWF